MSRGSNSLAEAAILLPALYLGLTEGKEFSFSWGTLVECLGYIEQVFELFSQLAQSKIIIFTTHRYDSIPRNTKIAVLVDGIISESGTHEELLLKKQDYWSLYMAGSPHKAVPALANGSNHTTFEQKENLAFK